MLGIPSYGLAIILFTLALRLLMFPLSLRQGKTSRTMQLLQPRVQQLQQQYKNNPEILNREMMALYKRYNASPMSGCLPLLIQMPILFALFNALRDFPYVAGASRSFLWIADLSLPDNGLTPTSFILPVIVGISSYLQSKLSLAAQPQQNSQQMKTMNMMMLYVMPVFLAWTSRNFTPGLSIYWAVFNTAGFLLQILINASVTRSHQDIKKAMEEEEALEARARAEKAAERAAQKQAAQKKTAEKRAQENKRGAGDGSKKKKQAINRGKPLDFDD
jgi:YidC/Oxa1 family membrane protein insertase